MKKGWTTNKLMATASLGVLNLIVSLTGAGLTIFTGIPGASGAINAIWGSIIIVFAVFLIQEFGTATIIGLIYSLLALPLPLQGTAGFLPKLLIGPLAGLAADITYRVFKKHERLAAISVGFVSQYVTGLLIFFLATIFYLPGTEKLRALVLSPVTFIGTAIIMGAFGYLGLSLYKKLANTAIVKRIQGSK